MTASYIIAIGSNRRGRHGSPAHEVAAAIAALGPELGPELSRVRAASPIITTAPIGPSIRRFANAVVLIDSAETPPDLLARLKRIERDFGRRRGQRWGGRVIDLDIILWSGGPWVSTGLIVPHPAFRTRGFVLAPLCRIAPHWRDPITGLSVRQLAYRARDS